MNSFQIPAYSKGLARWWMLTGVAALAVAGIFALILVIARTPQLKNTALFQKLFHEALVVHVDLSVLIWFLAIACMLWSMAARSRPRIVIPNLEPFALGSFAGGALLIALSPLDPNAEALMSNYIPVITSPIFFLGLGLVFCGVALQLLHYFLCGTDDATPGVYSAALITLIAAASFLFAYPLIPPVIDGTQYFELLFWGGGHVLQFTHTQILMVAWLALAAAVIPTFSLEDNFKRMLFIIGPLAVATSPLAFFLYDITSMEFREFFTWQMIVANGIAPALLALALLWQFVKKPRAKKVRGLTSALVMSWLLFIYGGILGTLITGQNVVIPAHYHGSIVGITLAFMGLAVLMLPRFGFAPQSKTKLAFWQPIIFGGGQILHISGLAWSGGYGALRKTPGTDELPMAAKTAMGLMGLGGLLAIIGGFLFVVIVIRAVNLARS